ncbi:MAG: DEAD/DEAH box helicase [Candidatus Undinarchaeales archaeon]
MKLSKLKKKYPELKKVVSSIEKTDGIEKLYPPQEEAVKKGLLDNKNLVLSMPTAGGKTLVAELAMLKTVLEGGKAVYIVPLRAIASEKYAELKEKYSNFSKIGISTGEFDSEGTSLGRYDIIIVTVEKMDSLMRHTPKWMKDIKLVALDEVHLLDSAHRGPTLEMVITRLKNFNPQFLALSATIQNSDELAKWMDAELIESQFRPVNLSRGIFVDGEVAFKEKDDLKLGQIIHSPAITLALDTVKKGAQSLVFVNTRRSSAKQAELTGSNLYDGLSTKEKKELSKLSKKILNVLDRPTRQCKRLANCVRKGTAFHHAGLHSKQRSLIEENFKNKLIKVICATPTLAAGVNLPGKRVIIRDYRRYGGYGLEPIPVLEIHQMFGRAGRPKYDKEGEAVLIARNMAEYEELWDHYIEGRPEPITSKLGVEPILRMHVLGVIAECPITRDNLFDFFGDTFYAYQYGNIERISNLLDRVLDNLFEWKFIDYDSKNKFKPTKLGNRIAQLYLDPYTAHTLIELLSKKLPDDIVLLTLLSDTAEMRPLRGVRSSETEVYDQFEKYDLKEEQLKAFKNAMVFFDWIHETSDDKIFEKYSIPPGTLRTKLNIADWLLYSCSEIAKIKRRKKIISKIKALRKRLKYGVKKELLPLVRVRNIGRVRARKLYQAGIKNIKDIRKADQKKLQKLLGKKISKKVKKAVEKDLK